MMDLTRESKACAACAKAKRRCGKQIPACYRCESRGVSCEYSSARTFCLPSQQPGQPRTSQRQTGNVVLDAQPDTSMTNEFLDISGDTLAVDDILALNFDTTILPSPPSFVDPDPKQPYLPWYLEPSSWEIGHMAPSQYMAPFCNTVLMRHIEQIQEWQARWVKTGSNPYIHKHIYKFQLPRCIQDAYTTLSAYLHGTPENKGILENLVEDRVRQLLQDQPPGAATENDNDDEDFNPEPAAETDAAHHNLTTFEHMARVHALHTCQTICLFDGAIRLRHVAETQIPTLNLWLRQLMASAEASASRGPDAFVLSLLLPRDQRQQQQDHHTQISSPLQAGATPSLVNSQYVSTLTAAASASASASASLPGPSVLGPEDTAWYAWAFAETIRRTWMVACATQTIYLTLQLRWAPCPGGAMTTTRGVLWEADTAFAWAAAAGGDSNGGGGEDGLDFVDKRSWERILEQRPPEGVDEYTLAALEVTFGMDRIQRWRARMGSEELRG